MTAGNIFDAIRAGDADAVRGLIGSDPAAASSRNAGGVSALMFACYVFNPEIKALLVGAVMDLDVFESSAVGDVPRLGHLLDADVSLAAAYSADGFTPLHLAGFFDQPAAARLLIDRGANVDAVTRNDMANRPLHAAAAGRSIPVCRMLLEAGADADACQHGGFTALHEAALNGNRELVELLLAHGADTSVPTDDGKTGAAIATEHGHEAIAARLRARGSVG